MNDDVKHFIEKNIELIEENRWEKIYKSASKKLVMRDIGQFTSCMLDAGIHPENHLKGIPEYFLSGSECQEFIIPNNIISIGKLAFFYCQGLTRAVISDNVISIANKSFYHCSSLTNLTIPSSVEAIGEDAFASCGDNLVIDYKGSKDDWKKIYSSRNFQNTYFIVNCTDGKIVKKKR